MDIHQLQIFVNVAECKGFLAASKKMHLSQSTVSTHVSALEHELGKKLIRRTARNFELTEDGVKLYKCSRHFTFTSESNNGSWGEWK